jgi:hypothetical protein
MDAMAAGTISSRPRRRANDRHSEQAPLRKYFRDRILRYSRNAAADSNRSPTERLLEPKRVPHSSRIMPGWNGGPVSFAEILNNALGAGPVAEVVGIGLA